MQEFLKVIMSPSVIVLIKVLITSVIGGVGGLIIGRSMGIEKRSKRISIIIAGVLVAITLVVTSGDLNGRNADSSLVRDISKVEEFESALNTHEVVVVDFYADWCAPCRTLKPRIARIAADYPDSVAVFSVNVDECKDLVDRHDVKGIPDVRIFKDGRLEDILVGVQPEKAYRLVLDRLVND